MKGRYWEGGIRVPMIARLPGKIPPGSTVHEPAIIMDVFATACAAAGVAPKEESIDGKDLMPLLTGAEKKGPHEAVASTRDGQIVTVRSGKWKLHLMAHGPAKEKVWRPDEKWTDPRAPDGTRILAPAGQAHPSEFPGLREGPAPAAGLLFDLEKDPGEQKDLSADHPDVVEQLLRHAKQLRDGMAAPGLR
jgi:arylsulfatase A-like enzyme